MDKCCSTCKWYTFEIRMPTVITLQIGQTTASIKVVWICTKSGCPYYGKETEDNFVCEEYER